MDVILLLKEKIFSEQDILQFSYNQYHCVFIFFQIAWLHAITYNAVLL